MAGGGGIGLQLRTEVELTANGLQVDSHLPHVHYPVVCNSQAPPLRREGRGPSRPPFLCSLEVAIASQSCHRPRRQLQLPERESGDVAVSCTGQSIPGGFVLFMCGRKPDLGSV